MKPYEVVTTQIKEDKGRVIHEYFDTFEKANEYANDICVNDSRTIKCSIYKNNILVMDVL